jgi:hypothetical protein
VLAAISRERADEETFPVVDADGAPLGVLSRKQLQAHGSGVESVAAAAEIVNLSSSFSATMHLGFAKSREYHLLIERHPASEQLATLLWLSPIIVAYAY